MSPETDILLHSAGEEKNGNSWTIAIFSYLFFCTQRDDDDFGRHPETEGNKSAYAR